MPDAIVPFAKVSGLTSFAALAQVRRLLGVKKVGHTGTLDRFADGLLLLLVGGFTKLAPVMTRLEKSYEARIQFGVQTDTLDPEGAVVRCSLFPTFARVRAALPHFTGSIDQVPPEYSALKFGGVRASDRVRRGEAVCMKARRVFVFDLQVLGCEADLGEFKKTQAGRGAAIADLDLTRVRAVTLYVRCSEGFYVRALARDIAAACGSCAYVSHLRRTRIGPFDLAQAAGVSRLGSWTWGKERASCGAACFDVGAPPPPSSGGVATDSVSFGCEDLTVREIKQAVVSCDVDFANRIGLTACSVHAQYASRFLHGERIRACWFQSFGTRRPGERALVFSEGRCLGLIRKAANGFSYDAVFCTE
ncbi:tRNA pseudouridine(55) synthase TruB [Treponema pallidum]|nr:tRNA pseudouridine(55) synthase TruB [Treponema pallidum]UZV79651.1 tRNA pseudouridine(55) synthase TruB [Treponema pallidum]